MPAAKRRFRVSHFFSDIAYTWFFSVFLSSTPVPTLCASLCPAFLQLIFMQVITICCCCYFCSCNILCWRKSKKNSLTLGDRTILAQKKELKMERMFAHINRLLERVCVCVFRVFSGVQVKQIVNEEGFDIMQNATKNLALAIYGKWTYKMTVCVIHFYSICVFFYVVCETPCICVFKRTYACTHTHIFVSHKILRHATTSVRGREGYARQPVTTQRDELSKSWAALPFNQTPLVATSMLTRYTKGTHTHTVYMKLFAA